jgi:membrane dipeptidase
MKIIDSHCDLLLKMSDFPEVEFDHRDERITVSYSRLLEGQVAVQFFAIYLDSAKPYTFDRILTDADNFWRKIIPQPGVDFIRTREDLRKSVNGNKLGAILSLEGVDGLGGSFANLHILHALGLRCLGFTWNNGNWAADGIGEPRGGGFTLAGRKLIRECDKLGIIMDVSHLSENAFWELAELSESPFIASHSNARAICPHRRNLTNEQINAIIARDGRIGITLVPWFVKSASPQISDVLRHIDHICALGGTGQIAIGSDFDGIGEWIPGLEHPGKFGNLVEALLKAFSRKDVEGFLFGNMYRYLETRLPE